MNYLAHLYLSGDKPEIMLGNVMGDYVKGNLDNSDYHGDIFVGLKLHRSIDTFTDQHAITSRSRDLLKNTPRRYTKILIDIFYDHFLARNWENYHHTSLEKYSNTVYQLIKDNAEILPPSFHWVETYMIEDDWLNSYTTFEGVADALNRANYRLRDGFDIEACISDLEKNYQQLSKDFQKFMPIVKTLSTEIIATLS